MCGDDADERWRAVLYQLVARASADPEFRARVAATGAVLDNLEAVLARTRVERTSAPSGAVACHTYWWGFQLEIPHAILTSWRGGAESTAIAEALAMETGPAAPFRRRAAAWVANQLPELVAVDQGAGVYASMTWMAPNIFVAVPIRVR